MNILMVTSETVPFSKSGGLADVVGALASALAKEGNDVKVFMPFYSFIDRTGFHKRYDIEAEMLSGTEKAGICTRKLGKVEYVALDHPYYSERKGIYGDTSYSPYSDNCPRFLFFAKAAASYIKASGIDFDIVHCHDWTAGLVPFYLKESRIKAKTVFTIHNLAYQGDFSHYDAVLAGDRFPAYVLSGSGDEKRINMLKAGLESADKITTVSSTYAKEIQTSEQGCGLDWLLRQRKQDLVGIVNGIDTAEWNPNTDKAFEEHFSARSLKGKEKLKARVQEEFGLEVNPDIPLFAMISRIADQKGFSELLSGHSPAIDRILDLPLQLLIIGTGDGNYERMLKDRTYTRRNLSVNILFSGEKAHRVEGGADFFLMPSRYEPCGLNQMYSLRYGTLPIAHRTGGLADTIVDLSEDSENGTGFLFTQMEPDAIIEGIRKALELYKDKDALLKTRKRAMSGDFSWKKSAEEYQKLYSRLRG